jgi:hypothetical protein
MTVADIPNQVGGFLCGPNAANPMPGKFLPGSCRSEM